MLPPLEPGAGGAGGVGEKGQQRQRALPHNRRLAGEQVAQQETAVGAVAAADVAVVQTDGQIGERHGGGNKPAQRLEEPAQTHRSGGAEPENGGFVAVHAVRHFELHQHGDGENHRGVETVFDVERAEKRSFAQQFVIDCGRGVAGMRRRFLQQFVLGADGLGLFGHGGVLQNRVCGCFQAA